MRVLVVDDCQDAADILLLLLRQMGCEGKVAYEGSTALKQAGVFRPHLIFIDLGMPGLDGLRLAAEIRRIPELAGALLVACTGYPQYKRQALDAGFDQYLLKPATLDQLRSILQLAAEKHAAERTYRHSIST